MSYLVPELAAMDASISMIQIVINLSWKALRDRIEMRLLLGTHPELSANDGLGNRQNCI